MFKFEIFRLIFNPLINAHWVNDYKKVSFVSPVVVFVVDEVLLVKFLILINCLTIISYNVILPLLKLIK